MKCNTPGSGHTLNYQLTLSERLANSPQKERKKEWDVGTVPGGGGRAGEKGRESVLDN